jgi:hypothetical protein
MSPRPEMIGKLGKVYISNVLWDLRENLAPTGLDSFYDRRIALIDNAP